LPSQYRFELATPDDDAQLRDVLAATPMPGAIQIAFRREPSYFAAAEVEGTIRQAIVCRQVAENRIVGCGSRSITMRWVNGHKQPVGYLSQLRLLPSVRRNGLLSRGYEFLRQLHSDGRAPFYLTTIAEDNHLAIRLLTSGRAPLPCYHDAGRYHTLVMTRRRLPKVEAQTDTIVRRATANDRTAVVEFLAAEGQRRQFFPHIQGPDLFAETGMFRGLAPSDLWLAWRGEKLCGTLGVWDQRTFRQQQIVGYEGSLRWLRGVYNLLAPAIARPSLPAPGAIIACRFAAIPVTAAHDPTLLQLLLRHALAECLAADESLLFGVHENDPWQPLLRRIAPLCYTTRLFLVCFADGDTMLNQFDGRPTYLELGCL